MNISITGTRRATQDEWDEIWESCDYATYFHSREWADIWSTHTHGEFTPQPLMVEFSDGKKAVIPLSVKSICKGLAKSCVSSPAGTFGGWISTDDLTPVHGALLRDSIHRSVGQLKWRLNPYDTVALEVTEGLGKPDDTHTLNLLTGFEQIVKNWTKGHKSATHKAQRGGVTVRLGSTEEDWRAYYATYEDSVRRWGDKASSVYDWSLFGEMFKRNSRNIRLWIADYEGQAAAGAVVFYAKRHVVYWHGAALEQYFQLRPVNLLIYESIRHACESGYHWFDFNPSGGHEGVRAFKKNFGCECKPCPVITSESGWVRAAGSLARMLRKR